MGGAYAAATGVSAGFVAPKLVREFQKTGAGESVLSRLAATVKNNRVASAIVAAFAIGTPLYAAIGSHYAKKEVKRQQTRLAALEAKEHAVASAPPSSPELNADVSTKSWVERTRSQPRGRGLGS